MIEELLARLLEKVEGRFFGKYRALVVDNADPENRGRLKLSVPSVLGGDVVSAWALPCAPYGGAADQGFFFIPEVEAAVWVEFEAGNLDYPVWVGTFWAKPGGASEVPKPGDSQSPPTRKIIRTLKGNSIEMEDKDSEEVFIITYNDGSKTNVVTMDKNGIAIVDANENKVTLDSSGVVIEDKSQNKIEMTATAINILPAAQIKIGSAAAILNNNLPACLFSGAPHSDGKGQATVMK
ncbi:MAG: phage baseplate assembly protein V [Pyrinomonadaceae bacterium]